MATKGRLNPFGDSSKNFVFFPSLSHKQGVHRIVRGLESNCGLILLTGEIGIGKTSLARHIQSYLSDRFVFVELGNPYQTPLEQVFHCCEAFGLETAGLSSIHDCVGRLEQYFHSVLADGKRPVIVFDESHLLTKRHLSLIHILSNLRAEDGTLVQILLVGQLEILDLLATEGMEALNQRIGVRCELSPLVLEDADKYISFKLDKGGQPSVIDFSKPAVERIWRQSSGLPRLINHICAHVMDSLAFKDTNVVTPGMVDEVCRDSVYTGMFQAKTNKDESTNWYPWALAAVVVLAVIAVGAVWVIRAPVPVAVQTETEQPLKKVQPVPSALEKAQPEVRPVPVEPVVQVPVTPSVEAEIVPEPEPTPPVVVESPSEQVSQTPEPLVVVTPSAESPDVAEVPEVPAEQVAGEYEQPEEVVLVVEEPYGDGEVASEAEVVQEEAAQGTEAGQGVPSAKPKSSLPPKDQIKNGASHPVIGKLIIGAIAWNENPSSSVAIINSNLLHEGETVDDVRVLNIGQDYILFEYSGEYYQLTFSR